LSFSSSQKLTLKAPSQPGGATMPFFSIAS